jgi:hypothetical protein
MANRDMLTEAIADAKALKETAIANAKAALEEAFTPRMKEMLSAKLQELDEEEHDEVDKMDEAKKKYRDDDRKDGGESKETKRTEKMKYGKDLAESEDIDEETDLDEILAELENDLSEDARTDAEEEGYEDGMEDEKEDEEDKEEDEDIDLEEMSEDDLKSFIEDVIKDMVESGELEAGEEFEGEDEESEDEEIEIEDEDETEEIMERKKEGYDDREDESVSARRGKEADKKQSFKDRRDDSYGKFGKRDAEAAGKASGPGKNKINKENLNEEEVNELYDLMMNPSDLEIVTGILAGLVGIPAASLAATYAKDGLEAVKRLIKSKKAGMEEVEKTDKMEEELEELRTELHEVNLLNAKLLYTNKIFRAKNLMETQKVKVLEAFDKATTVKEVKLVYETLNEGIKEKAPIRENLGSASKPAGVAPKQQIVEVDSQFARWQKLAGIIK